MYLLHFTMETLTNMFCWQEPTWGEKGLSGINGAMSGYQCLKSVPPLLISFFSSGCCLNLFIFLMNPLFTPSLFLCCLYFAPPGYLWTSALWHPWCSWCGNHVWPQKKLFSHRGQRPSGSLHSVTWAWYRSHTHRHMHAYSNATKFHPMPPSDISRSLSVWTRVDGPNLDLAIH